MAELVSAKWGMSVYSSDDHTFEYKQLANPQDHPAILRYFVDWEWYFLGQGNDRNQWLVSAAEESVEFTLLALLQMGKGKPIVVDTDIAPEFLRAIAGDERMVYVYAEDEPDPPGLFQSGSSAGDAGSLPNPVRSGACQA